MWQSGAGDQQNDLLNGEKSTDFADFDTSGLGAAIHLRAVPLQSVKFTCEDLLTSDRAVRGPTVNTTVRRAVGVRSAARCNVAR